jgi:hypothetical protein
MTLPASYRGLWNALTRYWGDYGGWIAFFTSPLLHISILISASSYSVWNDPNWIDVPLSLLPNLLGFSLGAYALIFSLANDRLLSALNAPTADGSPTRLRMVNATFLHFILIQTAAIIFAMANKSTLIYDFLAALPMRKAFVNYAQLASTRTAGAFGYFLTVYAVVLLIGAALAAYRLAIMSGRAASTSERQSRPPLGPVIPHDHNPTTF